MTDARAPLELKLHRDLYAGEAVDEAVKALAGYATFELAEEPSHWVVRIAGKSPERERRVAGELGNWALGLTVKRRGAAANAAEAEAEQRDGAGAR